MLKQRREAAEQLAALLFASETAIDEAVSQTAQLSSAMPAMRKHAGVSALVGQDALEQVNRALLALTDARRAMVNAHTELSLVQAQIGLGSVTLASDAGDKPPPVQGEGERQGRRLRAI